MKLHALPKTVAKTKKRLGLGYGSGRGGHTSSRGQKGQKARGDMPLTFVGSSWVWFKRLPFMKGKDRFKPTRSACTITLSDLNRFQAGDTVSPKTLHEKHLISKYEVTHGFIKIVASGTLTHALKVQVSATSAAKKAITQAGGEYLGETA